MSIERNIIFLYPISSKLKELKEELEKDEETVVYELDSVNEYGQLIGIMEHSVTFSSDMKKTEGYLTDCKQFVKSKNSKNIVVQNKTMPPHFFTKLQRLGLNEVIQEDVPLKNFLHKVNMFFVPFEQALIKEEEEKNKAVTEQFIGGNTLLGERKSPENYSSEERQRVEKMTTGDENFGELKSKKKKSSFDHSSLLGGQFNSNFILKSNNSDMSFLKSPFDNMQRKKVATFDPVARKGPLKRGTFTPVSAEFNQNPHKQLGIKPPGELNKRKSSGVVFDEKEINRRKIKFDEIDAVIGKKAGKFEEVQKELNRKRAKFEEVQRELEKKNVEKKDETEAEKKKRKRFDEVLRDLNKKRTDLGLIEDELKKKKNLFEGVEAELKKKKSLYDEAKNDLEKKKGILISLEELQRKKKDLFNEVEAEQKKRKKFIEEEIEISKIKKLGSEFESDIEKKKGSEFEGEEYEKKKGLKLDEVEIGRKNLKFDEVEIDKDKKKDKFQEVDNSHDKKHDKFEEVEREREQKNLNLKDPERNRKDGRFEEVKKESLFKKNKDIVIGRTNGEESDLDADGKKEYEENILDYSQFKKQYKEGKLSISEEKKVEIEKKFVDKILEEPEYTFYDNQSFGLEYLVIHNDFLLKDSVTADNLFKFIHFALIKEYAADITFYLMDPSAKDDSSNHSTIRLYSGHLARKNEILGNDFHEYETENLEKWVDTKLPLWQDETYQVETNEFIYPYFEDGKLLGFAVSHFKNTVRDHSDAAKVELLAMCLKGSILDEYILKNGKS
ncbi:MAG: hypothetical protein ACJAS4_001911 [Bacteriovoracaceae bacterium]|jgi:hypothetical protein